MRRKRSFSRRPRRRAVWDWAGHFTIDMADDGSANQSDTAIILPNSRTKWLCNFRKSDRVTFAGMLLWLDFSVYSPDVEHTANVTITDDIQLYIINSSADQQGGAAVFFRPYDEPAPPGGITSWDTSTTTDGDDPFLWTTCIAPDTMFLGSFESSSVGGEGSGFNSAGYITENGGGQVGLSRVFVNLGNANIYEPNVRVKAKRRLREDDVIVFGMFKPNGGVNPDLGVHYRVRGHFRMLFS